MIHQQQMEMNMNYYLLHNVFDEPVVVVEPFNEFLAAC
jgi:hypothetical protein